MTTLVRCCVCSFIILIHWCSTISAEVVDIPDPNLESAIREELSLPDQVPITQQEMLRLEHLDAGGDRGITDLAGLEYATNIRYIGLHRNPIVDISPLAHLTKLARFNLWGCQIVDLNPLRNLKNLRSIILSNNQISDISPLSELTNLTFLDLADNGIVDVSPLANLIQLEELRLNNNMITDITPLIGLKKLKKLRLANNPFHDFSPLLELEGVELDLDVDFSKLDELNLIVEVPDPNLEQLIREALSLSETVPLTQGQMLRLTQLDAGGDRGITDLAGLEYATNIRYIGLHRNPIVDISPLAHLTKLARFNLWGCQIVDLNPLRNLKNLRSIILSNNQISDISPLSELANLISLNLRDNQIFDFSPLANLISLEKLWINRNPGIDISSLGGLNLAEFHYDAPCHIGPPTLSVKERIENRIFPSVFAAWGSVGRSPVRNLPELSGTEHIALHDLYLCCPLFGLRFVETNEGWEVVGDLAEAQKRHDDLTSLNPNMLFLVEIRMHDAFADTLPEDWPYWLRDAAGNRTSSDENDYSQLLIDFTLPGMQDIIVQQAIAVAKCGLYDGIFFDWWNENHAVLANNTVGWSEGYRGLETELRARDNILQRIRAEVSDDFLIMVNTNKDKIPRTGPYINGTFMETFKDHPGGYSHNELQELESTLSWAELNLREPRINGLEAQGLSIEPPDGPNNLRMMRAITTLSLTHSDGYVLYTDGTRDLGGPHHHHLWHSFWDANLGKPIGPKAELYQNVDGLFIREFTNGWAVYNRSGAARTITLPASATPVSDRGNNAASQTHTLPDLDGEIYLKSSSFADVNGDGHVNILDLIQVTNSLGKTAPDPNGDGVVNILDLVFVTEQFSQ